MENTELRELVSAARNGSEQAYQGLVCRFAPGLMGYFYRNTGNRTEAEDLLQEVFLRLVKGLPAYQEKERFAVWLYRMAQHLLIDFWRKRKVTLTSEDWVLEQDVVEQDPSARSVARDQEDELQRALKKLSPEQREVITLRYFSGLSFEEISKLNGTPLGTALARAHRGLGKLRELLTETKP